MFFCALLGPFNEVQPAVKRTIPPSIRKTPIEIPKKLKINEPVYKQIMDSRKQYIATLRESELLCSGVNSGRRVRKNMAAPIGFTIGISAAKTYKKVLIKESIC